MSATTKGFTEQQKLANKKHSELTDNEKIILLKREIDNLRGQIREQNGGSLKRTTTSSSSKGAGGGFCPRGSVCHQLPLLSVFLLVGLVLVAHMRRRKVFEAVGEIVNTGLSLVAKRRRSTLRSQHQSPSSSTYSGLGMMTEGFELTEHSSSSSSLESEIIVVDCVTTSETTSSPSAAASPAPYEAPDAAATTQFV